MNKQILNTDIQLFIENNLNTDISSLLLKKQCFEQISQQDLVEQIESKNKCQKKLPTWFKSTNIYYPNKLNIEQTSSETTAQYKANFVEGKSLIDLTGGLGIDCFYFAKKINQITHCEINENLSKIVHHNYQQLNTKNIKTIPENGITYLTNNSQSYDWIYIDPSRRNDVKGKVFLLEDCLPNVPEHIDLLFSKTDNILIKTSPILDISNGIKALRYVKTIHVIAVKNEVKELLFHLERNYTGKTTLKAVNLESVHKPFEFNYPEDTLSTYSTPLNYLYEPNAAVLKSGGFNTISKQLSINKLHKHSHLYTSNNLQEFPGRRFKIIEVIPYQKKNLKKRFNKQQYNVTTRNFPKSVAEIRKETSIKDGGIQHLFFTTDIVDNKIVILCNKA